MWWCVAGDGLGLAINLVSLLGLVGLAHLKVLLAQALIVLITSVMSWVGHKHYSFRRPASSEGPKG